MLWEVHQTQQIGAAERSAEKASNKASHAQSEVMRLTRQVNRLALACQAMWELVRDSTDLTEDELNAKILEVDLRDGKADAKMSKSIMPCPECGRNTNSGRSLCLMCGAPLSKPHAFE